MRKTLTVVCLLMLAAPSLAAPPRGGPPGLERGPRHRDAGRREPPPPHVIEALRDREPEILKWLVTNDPEAHKRLMELRGTDERSFIGHLLRASRLMERAMRDPEVVERHQRMSALEDQIREKSRGWAELDAKAQGARRDEVAALVAELFEIRQDERRAHLAELEERIAEIDERLDGSGGTGWAPGSGRPRRVRIA